MSFSPISATSNITPATSFTESLPKFTSTTSFSTCFYEPTPEATPEPDPFDLQRYVDAQDDDGIFERVLEAIRAGGKIPRPAITWIWAVFPQMDHCGTRRRPGRVVRPDRDTWPRGKQIKNLDEARAILKHSVLGPRMQRLAHALLETRHADIFCVMDHQILDVQRIHSTMTIFREASRRPTCLHGLVDHGGTHGEFREVLDKHFSYTSQYSDDEMTWGEPMRPIKKRSARHQATVRRLETMDINIIERRMVSKQPVCICGKQKAELDRLDKKFLEKIEERRNKKIQRQVNNRFVQPQRWNVEESDEPPPGWLVAELPVTALG